MKTVCWLIIVLSAITSNICDAAILSGRAPSLVFTYKNTYDSNVLRYSQRDSDRFLDGIEPYTSPIRTLDDLRTDFRLTGLYRYKLLTQYNGRLQVSMNFAHYLQNPIKNAGWTSITLKQDIAKSWSVLLNYFYEPKYYIRDYTDVHTGERHNCEFAMDKTVGKLYFRPVKLAEFTFRFENKRYTYTEYFTEYDGNYISFGGGGIIRTGRWRFSAEYDLGAFVNEGFSSERLLPPGDYGEDSETGEGDYQEDNYTISIQYAFRLAERRSSVKLELNLADRYYTTNRNPAIDPIHHGRRDVYLMNEFSGSISINKKLDLSIGVGYNDRNSRASDPIVSEIKDYRRWNGWVELSYELL